ncbi:trimethyltridecatetraene synthase-like [Miscanthus floridulus]|uniref:trimethyltridecatetraene synthase-like n=1 Tax=Miscanthus floridulus TaxID=154761 RepID=UPI003458BD0E
MEVPVPPRTSSSLATTILLATALFLVTTTILRRCGHQHRQARKHNIPLGPRLWPVISNLNLLGTLPHRTIHELSARYGALMSLRFGAFPAVVSSSVEVAEVLFMTQDLAYLDRPCMACGKYTV